MVLSRFKRFRSRRFTRRRSTRRRSLRIKRSIRAHGRVMTFKRMSSSNDVVMSTDSLGNYSVGVQFTLADLPNYTEFTSLFQSYRIKKVVVRYIPLNGSSGVSGTGGALSLNTGLCATVIDYNDASTATLAALQEFRTCKIWNMYRQHSRTIYPKVANEVYISGVSTGYSDGSNPWCSTNSASIPHYGFKVSIGAAPASVAIGRLQYTYYIQVRDYA